MGKRRPDRSQHKRAKEVWRKEEEWKFNCLWCKNSVGEPVGRGIFRLGEGLCRCVNPILTKDGVHTMKSLTLRQHLDASIRGHARDVIAEREVAHG